MKKRRELDAMASRMKPIKNGSHELLRSASFSSENEDLLQSDQENFYKKSSTNSCYIYTLLYHIVIVIAMFASIGGLLWMLMQVKNQVHDLKVQLSSLSSENQAINIKLQEISVKCLETSVKMAQIRTSLGSVQVVPALQAINKKISSLSNHSENSSSLKLLIKDLPKRVAEMASSAKTLQQEVTDLKASMAAKELTKKPSQFQDPALKLLRYKIELEKISNFTNVLNLKFITLESNLHVVKENKAQISALTSQLNSFRDVLSRMPEKIPDPHVPQHPTSIHNGSTSSNTRLSDKKRPVTEKSKSALKKNLEKHPKAVNNIFGRFKLVDLKGNKTNISIDKNNTLVSNNQSTHETKEVNVTTFVTTPSLILNNNNGIIKKVN